MKLNRKVKDWQTRRKLKKHRHWINDLEAGRRTVKHEGAK